MKTLSGKKLLQDLGLKAGELVRVGDTVYRYDPEVYGRGTKWDRMTPVKNCHLGKAKNGGVCPHKQSERKA